jgi:hypothetical protein
MKDLVKMVSQKAGISEPIAKIAVETVLAQLKKKMPKGMGDQLESLLGDNSKGGSDSSLGGLAGKLGGMLGKK